MTRHVFKLVWNRKRSTSLILIEILVCFLVLCGIFASAFNGLESWRQPLGFAWEDVWYVDIGGRNWNAEGEELAADRQAHADLLRAIRSMEEVEAAGLGCNMPYSSSAWYNSTWIDGQSERVEWTLATPEMKDVLGLEMVHGRWIEETDGALNYSPVVISQGMARALFGLDDPVGKDLPQFDQEGQPEEPEDESDISRVVGVAADVRRGGEFSEMNYVTYYAIDLVAGESLPSEMLVRVRPGTTAAFEEKLVRTMQSIAPTWSFDTTMLEDQRHDKIMAYLGPIIIASVVALFLILMVGLGLVGVLWLSVTRRTSEMGLRRALGATGGSVQRQVLGELWALTTLATAVGAVIFVQVPLFGGNFGVGWPVFLSGLAAAVLVTFGFVTVCGLYPTWLVTRIHPATALQCE